MSIVTLRPEGFPHGLESEVDHSLFSSNGIAVCLVSSGLYVAMMAWELFIGFDFDAYVQNPLSFIALG